MQCSEQYLADSRCRINISSFIPGETVLGGGRASTEEWEVKPRELGDEQNWERVDKGQSQQEVLTLVKGGL